MWSRKKNVRPQITEPKEVKAMKQKAKQASKKAETHAKKLNELLEANGITLQIYIATGGKHHGP